MRPYLELVEYVLTKGLSKKRDPQGVGNLAICGYQMRFPLAEGFPLITTRKISFKVIREELLWMLSGSSLLRDLHDRGVHVWDSWGTKGVCEPLGLKEGDLGPIYGHQWRHWKTRDGKEIDQIARAMEGLKQFPESRRHYVTAWNPEDVTDANGYDRVFVAPCIRSFQFFWAEGKLSLYVTHGSADVIIGLPFDIAEYALLLLMMAKIIKAGAYELVYALTDAHIYLNYREVANMLLSRKPRPLPTVTIAEKDDIFSFASGDFAIKGYDPHPTIPDLRGNF